MVVWVGDRRALLDSIGNCDRQRASAQRRLTPVNVRARAIDYRVRDSSARVSVYAGASACGRERASCSECAWTPAGRCCIGCDQHDSPIPRPRPVRFDCDRLASAESVIRRKNLEVTRFESN